MLAIAVGAHVFAAGVIPASTKETAAFAANVRVEDMGEVLEWWEHDFFGLPIEAFLLILILSVRVPTV